MIALDTFIVFQKDIIDGPLKLEDLIPRYWQYKQGLMALGMQHIYRAVNDSALSFDAFLGLNRKKRKVPEVFSSFGKLLFEERKSKDF
jgi:hypothetical protein